MTEGGAEVGLHSEQQMPEGTLLHSGGNVDAISVKNTVPLALDWRTSINKWDSRLVDASYMDDNVALRDIQLAFDEVDSWFLSY